MSISVRNTVKILVCAALAFATTRLIVHSIIGSAAMAGQRAVAQYALVAAPEQAIQEITVYASRGRLARTAASAVRGS